MNSEGQVELTEVLSKGNTFAVHRGFLGTDKKPVIVKTPVHDADMTRAVSRLDSEFAITRDLDVSGVSVASSRIDAKTGPMLVFNDEGLIALNRIGKLPLEAADLTKLATVLVQTIGSLHNTGIVHRDINPSNIVVSPDLSVVRIIDFGIAISVDDLASIGSESQAGKGTPAYMAPEQTGRMSVAPDHRSDLYSLVVTLYELATGNQPFEDAKAATVMHRHMTLVPKSASELNPQVPKEFSRTIDQLIEKNPEDRFQSAAEFLSAISQHSVSSSTRRLSIPDKLYGREKLISQCSDLISDGIVGHARLIRVSGPSGVGKSAIIARVAREAAEASANFVQGKFDQLDQARPYSAFLQAFESLLTKILANDSATVDAWRERLLDELSPNAQVLLDVLPAFEKLLGPQPPVLKLGLNEAQIRMSLVVRRFVRTLASRERPLIVFLDDLQWADSASRALMEMLLSDNAICNLTLLTAYRDNEVGPGHPVSLLFSKLHDRQPLAPVIEVGPLAVDDIALLIGETLETTTEKVRSLAEITQKKTAGNPFFIRQFLQALVRNGPISQEPETGRWLWDNDRIAAEKIADNVADLVVERILDLPPETQSIIKLAACCGNDFETSVLALVAKEAPEQINAVLKPAVESEVVFAVEGLPDREIDRYRFQHDRVQHAAYTMSSPERRSQMHADVGAILLRTLPEDATRQVEVTDHLISGFDCLGDDNRLRLRDLAFNVAQRMMASNAYEAASRYLDSAESTFDDDIWKEAAPLAFSISLERAQAAYLQNQTELATNIANSLLDRELSPLDEVRVLELTILLHTSQLNYRQALTVGLKALSLLGESLPLDPGMMRVAGELITTKLKLARKSDEELLALPQMVDERKLAAMRVLVLLSPPAYFSSPNLLPIIALRMVRLSVRYGNAPHSAYGYVVYGMLHCAVLGDPKRGLAYGDLARRATVDLGGQDIEGRVLMIYAGFIQHWNAGIGDTLPIFLEGADKAISAGDLEYHGYTRYGHASYALIQGQPLERVSGYLEGHLAAVTDSRHEKTRRIMTMALESIGRMRGLPGDSSAGAFDPDENFRLWTEQADATSLAYFHKYKMLEALTASNYAEVLVQARAMTANLNGILSMAYQPYYQFYEALAIIELSEAAPIVKRKTMLLKARLIVRRLERWAKNVPQNFSHRAILLRAEFDRLAGRSDSAIAGFESAVSGARQSGALHDVGLFLERAARYYLKIGVKELAAVHMSAACAAHRVWGGETWAKSLEQRFPQLIQMPRVYVGSATQTQTVAESLVDSETLIRSAGALSQLTSLDDVVRELLGAAVVNAGAIRGTLLLLRDDELQVVAQARDEQEIDIVRDLPVSQCETIPKTIVNYVQHAVESVVINDVTQEQDFREDAYIAKVNPKSVLCVPLVSKGSLVGAIYLENASVRGVFTQERCRTIEVLGAQAAVSMENARLIEDLRGALERQVDLTSAHARFVPHTFLEMLDRDSITDVRLGDHLRDRAAILFSDIRGFTALLESMSPEEAIQFINAYLSKMEPPVQAAKGFIDSYIGDAVMAVFNEGPEAAIDAGIEMAMLMREWRHLRELNGEVPIRIGIGIATGELIFGTIGAANRLKCGVIGDTVNVASRVEGLTKYYGASMLITGETHAALEDPDKYQVREVDTVQVSGREMPVQIFEICDADRDEVRVQKVDIREKFQKAVDLRKSGSFRQAAKLLQKCRKLAPDDLVTERLLDLCEETK